MVLNYIDFGGGERKIFRGCVDKLWVGVKSYTLKKLGDITMYSTGESGYDKE